MAKSTVVDQKSSTKPPPIAETADTCLVCGDYSDYKTFGIPACHGCTNFFKRTVNAGLFHVCTKEGNFRLCCRHCRFEKCKATGMIYEGKEEVENNPPRLYVRRSPRSHYFPHHSNRTKAVANHLHGSSSRLTD